MFARPSCHVASAVNCHPRYTAIGRCGLRAVVLGPLLLALAIPVLAETWVDASGQFKVEAQFLTLRGNDLFLKKANGVTIKVPLDRLNAESQEQARRLAAASRSTAAPPAGADSPEAAARTIKQGLEAGNVRVVWDALPASYQKDVNDVVHTFAGNMDAELWKKGAGILAKATQVLKTKKKFILAHPLLDKPQVPKDKLEANWDNIVAVLEAVVKSEIVDLTKLKTVDVGAFLDGSGKQIVEKVVALAKAAEAGNLPVQDFPGIPVNAVTGLADVKIGSSKVDGDQATLSIEKEGKTEEVQLVRIEGKWLPKEMVAEWADGIAKAKEAVANEMKPALEKNKMSVLIPMGIAEGVLDQLLAAQTQEQFNQVLDGVMQMFQAKGPPGKLPPNAAPPSSP